MAETTVVLNPGVGGSSIASFADAGARIHQEVIIQTQNGGSDPVSVNNSGAPACPCRTWPRSRPDPT